MNCATAKGFFRIIQSIPSPKAEPFKLWIAQVAAERLSQMQDPETFSEHMDVARRGGNVARTAREQLEKELGHSVISPDNAKSLATTDLPELER